MGGVESNVSLTSENKTKHFTRNSAAHDGRAVGRPAKVAHPLAPGVPGGAASPAIAAAPHALPLRLRAHPSLAAEFRVKK
jgi:hypothetical protein